MHLYRFLFFIVYSRWLKKDKDTSLATFTTLVELSIYLGANVVGIVLNISLWFGKAMPGVGASKPELLIGAILLMIIFYFIHYFTLVHRGRREEILNEFKNLPKKELTPLNVYVALYALFSLVLLVGLPLLYFQIN